ncbi:hypothetical protein [Amphibacillus indicireducens]|uniref:Uncharacterized protein n=1 Tax=Amphibacillus indicireducens TaxID=1076330 RepID=A0ABP7W234_9BACI
MEELLDLLVPLLTFVFVIGGSIVKSFSDKQKEEAKKQAPAKRNIYSQQKQVNEPKRERFERFEVDDRQFESQQNEQFEQLRKDLNISTKSTISSLDDEVQADHEDLGELLISASRKKVITKKEMGLNKYFTDKGLAGSIVMSEILGQPRSKRPYHPHNR